MHPTTNPDDPPPTIDHIIDQLEEALHRQETEEGRVASTPTVSYCVECDTVAVDTWRPDGCLEHVVLSSDGYEHDGIGAALDLLTYLKDAGGV